MTNNQIEAIQGNRGRTTIQAKALWLSAPAWMDQVMNRVTVCYGGHPNRIDVALTPAAAQELGRYKLTLEETLADSGLRHDFADAIEAMLIGKTHGKIDNETMAIKGKVYREILSGKPEWAVCAAAREAASTDSPFPENAGQILSRVEAILEPLHIKLHQCRVILSAIPDPDYDAERKARISQHVANLKTGMLDRAAALNASAQPEPKETPEQALERLKALGLAGLELSPQLHARNINDIAEFCKRI